MTWLDNVRNASHEKKVRIIWICIAIAIIILIIAWVVTSRYQKRHPSDTNILQTISQGISNLRTNYQNPLK